MRATRTLLVLAALQLTGCKHLQQAFHEVGLYEILPAPGSTHLNAEPLACGALQDPVPDVPEDEPIVGAADLHLHQFSNIGFGGRLLWGEPFHEEGPARALSACGVDELCLDERESFVLCQQAYCRFTDDQQACERSCRRATCGETPPHGRGGLTDAMGFALGQGFGHDVTGYPGYRGWPRWDSYTHQQVYHRWLRRAFDGGMKLVVMMAVTNEVLCRFWEREHGCDDMTNADLQLDAAEELEQFVDYQNDCQLNGNGWYRIARSPDEARRIIHDGAMAVVLGLEVDTLFNCYQPGGALHDREPCTEEVVQRQIREYRARGVRHVFPVHVFDNAFGGAALYRELFNFGNAYVNERPFEVVDCSDDYGFKFGETSSGVQRFIATVASTLGFDMAPYPDTDAHCNARGLTDLGEATIGMLMDAGFIIDVDHMSANMREGVIDIAEARPRGGYPGLVSGHAGFTALYRGPKKSEGQLTPTEVQRLLDLGGMLAPIPHQGGRQDMIPYAEANIPNDCGHSAKSFAQAYLYAVDQTREHRTTRPVAVGIGSDLNGFAGMPAPRFGPDACAGDGERQREDTRVDYPIELYDQVGGLMDRPRLGPRELDINTDGYAHAGMFPDFVAELRAIGVTEEQLAPLFASAEAYIRLWEAVEHR
ncbi:MAG: hypothetical protein PVI30_13040 [Myxococcales bacterium]